MDRGPCVGIVVGPRTAYALVAGLQPMASRKNKKKLYCPSLVPALRWTADRLPLLKLDCRPCGDVAHRPWTTTMPSMDRDSPRHMYMDLRLPQVFALKSQLTDTAVADQLAVLLDSSGCNVLSGLRDISDGTSRLKLLQKKAHDLYQGTISVQGAIDTVGILHQTSSLAYPR